MLHEEGVQPRRAGRGLPDEAAEERVDLAAGADAERQIRLDACGDGRRPRQAADRVGDRRGVASGDGDVREREPVVDVGVGRLEVVVAVVGGDEDRHPEGQGECDRGELHPLTAGVADELAGEEAYHWSASASTGSATG